MSKKLCWCNWHNNMTVKELIERLKHENPDALVYREYSLDEGEYFAVVEVKRNVLQGTDDTVVIT